MTKEKKTDYKKTLKNISQNYWAISTIILAIILIIVLMPKLGITGGAIGIEISEKEIGQKALTIVNSAYPNTGLISINDDEQFYKIIFSIQGQEVTMYATKDGKNLIPQLIPLETRPPQPQTSTFSEENNKKIQEFSSCLVEQEFRVYGAAWCGHCQTFIKTFGGMQNLEGVFIECSDANRQPTEHAQLCSDEQVQSFPTMKLKGEVLQIPRTFEAIAEATGCTAPQLD